MMKVGIKKSDVFYTLRICSVLLIITMFIAFLLSFVNAITKDVIASNDAEKMKEALSSFFPNAASPVPTELDGEYADTVNAFYAVKDGDNGEIIGYYADVSPVGFKGEVGMMIGLDTSGAVVGISIISCDETVGIGTKIKDETFLSGFVGIKGSLKYKKGAQASDTGYIDGISGATYSSKAVITGVDAALSAYTVAVGVK